MKNRRWVEISDGSPIRTQRDHQKGHKKDALDPLIRGYLSATPERADVRQAGRSSPTRKDSGPHTSGPGQTAGSNQGIAKPKVKPIRGKTSDDRRCPFSDLRGAADTV
jgi:hypothetical protein